MLTEQERNQFLVSWNDTAANYPQHQCIHQLFTAQVERTPDSVTVVFENQHLTYRELNHRANQLAHYLQGLGVKPEVLVGLCVERSLDMVVAMLGILKAGGAYVPLDPAYPSERIGFMIEDAGLSIILTQNQLATRLQDWTPQDTRPRLVRLDQDWQKISQQSPENPDSDVHSDHLAYVIYTSGSTGKPKGVQITHKSVVNFLSTMGLTPGLSDRDTLIAIATISFDMSVLELYLPLISGARCIIVSREVGRNAQELIQVIERYNATVMQATPATWRMLLAAGWQGNKHLKVLCGGESWTRELADQLLAKCASVWNMYGPTEATVWSTRHQVQAGVGSIPIGRPIANTQIYLLDANLQPLPIGEPGELHIGGVGLARGYLNRAELTAEKFIANPFSPDANARLYKTGDLARYREDGTLEFLGRIDHQVKIQGFRIELGEIETLLNRHPGVHQSAVVVQERQGENSLEVDKRLVAYIVPEPSYQGNDAVEKAGAQDEQISQWQQLWDLAYRQEAQESDPTFNISGWNDSYTGAPIPPDQMREWLEGTVERILATRPQRVLEIGCGTGMLLFRIAPHCHSYYGIDLAPAALHYIETQMAKLPGDWSGVRLCQGLADEVFTQIQPGEVDTVIINSVVQLFPGIDYLVDVLSKAVEVVKPGGVIFLGDIRSLPLQGAFHSSIQLSRSPDELPRTTLAKRVRKSIAGEWQMTIDPDFFTALAQHLPQISGVEIQLRRGRYENEMSKFRYDAILHSGKEAVEQVEPSWLDWREEQLTVVKVRDRLLQKQPEILGIKRVPNARVLAEVQLFEWLQQTEAPATVGELRQALAELPNSGVEPEDWWGLSDELPYRVTINWSGAEAIGCYDVLFQAQETAQGLIPIPPNLPVKPWTTYANNPLRGKLASQLEPELRRDLPEHLPDYMIPTAFVILDEMPLTPNGKVNRRALPAPERSRPDLATALVMAQTETEQAIAKVWQDLLQLEVVGIHDNFFELGGNSLLLTQVHHKLVNQLDDSLSMITLFQYPTIATLAQHLSQTPDSPSEATRPSSSRRRSRQSVTQTQKQRRQQHRRGNSRGGFYR